MRSIVLSCSLVGLESLPIPIPIPMAVAIPMVVTVTVGVSIGGMSICAGAWSAYLCSTVTERMDRPLFQSPLTTS